MKAVCIDGFAIEKVDDNGFCIENDFFIVDNNSIWNVEESEYRLIDGEIRLTNCNDEWIEITKEHFNKNFKVLTGREHELKIMPEYFEDVKSGKKTFVVRKNDRGFGIGDVLVLKEFCGENYTGRKINKLVSYILSGGKYGINKDYVILGIK